MDIGSDRGASIVDKEAGKKGDQTIAVLFGTLAVGNVHGGGVKHKPPIESAEEALLKKEERRRGPRCRTLRGKPRPGSIATEAK